MQHICSGLLSTENPIRVFCFNLASHPYFDQFILFLIGVSTICLCIDEPYIENCKTTTCSGLFTALDTIDKALSWLFIAEMTIKMIALGLIGDENAYLRNSWNVLDFFIVCVSIYSWTQDTAGGMNCLVLVLPVACSAVLVSSDTPPYPVVVNRPQSS